MYIFAKAFITPQQNLLLETDELIFQTDNSIQKVKLIAWAKDVNILNGLTIHSDTTLSNNKAFLLKKDFIVNENATLNLSPGTELYFQRNTSLIINGGINAQGTKDSMIIIKSSRIEDDYYNIPSQWNGLQINNNKTNILNNVHISQAIQALRLGDVLLQNSGPNVSISNCIFSFSSYAAIEAYNAKINASNLIVYNSYLSNYGVIIKGGGTYSFKHATIYCDQPHSVPLISFSNEGYSGKHNALDLIIANSVIYGPERTEYEVGSLNLGSPSTYKIINSAIKTIENTSDTSIYKEIVKIESALIFSNPSKFKFEPDSLSKLVDNGDITIATSIPYDLNNNNRLNDGFPDIGAIERNP